MCGIGGFVKEDARISTELIDKMSRKLALELETRGRDATGVYTSVRYGIIHKQPGPARSFDDYPKKYGRVTFVHCRAATHGSPKENKNNHPIFGSKYVLIHNGVIRMPRLKNYSYKGEVDSEIILSYIEKMGVKEGLKQLEGSAALAFCKREKPNKVYLYAWSAPLSVGYVPGYGVIFASTRQIIQNVTRVHFHKWHKIWEPVSIKSLDDGDLWEIDVNTFEINIDSIIPSPKRRSLGNTVIKRVPWQERVYGGSRDPVVPNTDDDQTSFNFPTRRRQPPVDNSNLNLSNGYYHYRECAFCHLTTWTRKREGLNICERCDSVLGDDECQIEKERLEKGTLAN